ncbi:DAK2 domain-containing protein [Caenimonas soli]|uniref:DAK2 domain-containing protein n=1 Tax=Caenimonas soli TaxID=2735555 RepID=UPI001553CAD8|nr:DAK2 domain-containing protein [Caenimonas soli]NPC54558.1 DAK2 domain-containing protein [Caenimonas soli]
MQTVTPIVDAAGLHAALARWCDAMEAAAPELNALDGRLGDGDLGATLSKCAGNVRELFAAPPVSLETLLKSCAQACARASGSSFGTLLAVGFMQAARIVGTRQVLGRDDLVEVLTGVQQALSQRGGAALGDKTMLDSIDFIARALKVCDAEAGPQPLKQAAVRGAELALEVFRQQPNRIGRARMFAERSIGMDDPGMVAVRRMAQAL